jgi:hypothetical protein
MFMQMFLYIYMLHVFIVHNFYDLFIYILHNLHFLDNLRTPIFFLVM